MTLKMIQETKAEYNSQLFKGINKEDTKHIKTYITSEIGHKLADNAKLEDILGITKEVIEKECTDFIEYYSGFAKRWRNFERPISTLYTDCCIYADFIIPRTYLKCINRYDEAPANIDRLLDGYIFKYHINEVYSKKLADLAKNKILRTYHQI